VGVGCVGVATRFNLQYPQKENGQIESRAPDGEKKRKTKTHSQDFAQEKRTFA